MKKAYRHEYDRHDKTFKSFYVNPRSAHLFFSITENTLGQYAPTHFVMV